MSDLRDRLNTALESISDETLRVVIDEFFSGGVKKWGLCPRCKKKVQVDYPDYKGFTKAFATLMDQAKGKPAEEKRVVVDITARRLEDFRGASDEELVAIIESDGLPPVA